MNAPNQKAQDIFAEAIALADPTARHTYLDRACGGDSALYEEVESLWRAHEQAGDFLRRTVRLAEPDFVFERTGTMIGRYKYMKVQFSSAMSQLAAAGLLLLLTGCQTVEKYSLTYRLWDNEDLRKWSEPAPNPNLALFQATNGAEVLVQYDAFSEKHSTVKRRAYFLQPNKVRIAAGKKPKLVSLWAADGMKPIPVLPTLSAITNLPPGLPAYAVVISEGRGFTLNRTMESEATSDLPVYAETDGTATRLVLTPFAVVGDTVMVGAVAAVVGFLLWVQSGAPIH